MSLDVKLTDSANLDAICIRVYGNDTHELTWGQWLEKFPDLTPYDYVESLHRTLYSANITGNLGRMADEAGIGDALWEPNEHGMMKARDLIAPLKAGLQRMKESPDHFKSFDAKNGWGTYEQFIPWIENYLAACEMYPDADVSVSR